MPGLGLTEESTRSMEAINPEPEYLEWESVAVSEEEIPAGSIVETRKEKDEDINSGDADEKIQCW